MTRDQDNPAAMRDLAAFLDAPDRPAGTLRYHGLQGFLFAIATAPGMIPTSEWLPAVFGEAGDPEAGSEEEAERVVGALMALSNRINEEVMADRVGLPEDLATRPDPMANMGPDAPLGQWSAGFSVGMDFLQEVWDPVLEAAPEELESHFFSFGILLSLFSSRDFAEDLRREVGPQDQSLAAWAGLALAEFDRNMAGLAEMGRLTFQALETGEGEEPMTSQPVRRQKIGRNEPCPCGSGNKYKTCCGRG